MASRALRPRPDARRFRRSRSPGAAIVFERIDELVGLEAEPVEVGIDLDVHRGGSLALARRCTDAPRKLTGVPEREFDVCSERIVERVGAEPGPGRGSVPRCRPRAARRPRRWRRRRAERRTVRRSAPPGSSRVRRHCLSRRRRRGGPDQVAQQRRVVTQCVQRDAQRTDHATPFAQARSEPGARAPRVERVRRRRALLCTKVHWVDARAARDGHTNRSRLEIGACVAADLRSDRVFRPWRGSGIPARRESHKASHLRDRLLIGRLAGSDVRRLHSPAGSAKMARLALSRREC